MKRYNLARSVCCQCQALGLARRGRLPRHWANAGKDREGRDLLVCGSCAVNVRTIVAVKRQAMYRSGGPA